MKSRIWFVVIVFLLAAAIIGGIYVHNKNIEDTYNNAVNLIKSEAYEDGLAELDKANPEPIDRDDFMWDARRNEIEKPYKNTIPLYAYALAQIEYKSEDVSLYTVNDLLDLIPANYGGELSEEIKKFKADFKPQYDDYLAERERIAEQERQKQLQETKERLKNTIPYEGMSESYIDLTAMGKHHAYESSVIGKGKRNEHIEHEYKWMTNSGKTILIVDCEDGVVESVYKYWEDKYWTADGKPIYSGTRSGYSSSSSGKKKVYNDDSYNVNDYYDAEDFYEDYYDDFYDYEDAEDYFDENRDW